MNWERLGRFIRSADDYEDRSSTSSGRFYRGKVIERNPSNEWANQFSADLVGTAGKFLFRTNDPNHIFFHYPWMLHQGFAREQMPEFQGMSAAAFDEIALYPSKQKIVLGGLHVRNGWFGIEFVTYEPYSPEALLQNFRSVASRMAVDTNRLAYVPNARERDFVLANRAFFETNGMQIRELGEIYTNSAVQARGWALGTLKFVASTNLDAAIAAGEITRDTILVTDESPRDLPPVAGLISLNKSSPHSHTVLRLQSSLLPYLDLPVAHQGVISGLLGEEVLLVTMGVDEWHLVEVRSLTRRLLAN